MFLIFGAALWGLGCGWKGVLEGCFGRVFWKGEREREVNYNWEMFR